MKVTEHFQTADKTQFTFEILPPLKGENLRTLYDHIDPLMEFKPPFIDVDQPEFAALATRDEQDVA